MTDQEILAVAQRKGAFEVFWRYRGDALRRKCNSMVRAGKLRRVQSAQGRDVYEPQGEGK